MTKTGAVLLNGLSTFLDDYHPSTTTSAGASGGTTIIDTALEIYGDNRLVGWWIRITEGSGAYQVSRITNNTQATGAVTVSPPFTLQIASGIDYELHQYSPKAKFAALDSARLQVASDVFQLIVDETITTEDNTREYTIPTSIERGPSQVYLEEPMSPVTSWNVLANPLMDSTTDWTVSGTGATIATYATTELDAAIPKYGTSCLRMFAANSQAATLTQTVSAMSITAAEAAGREMTAAMWVYLVQTGGTEVDLNILTDAGTLATSADHQGLGWELLHVTGTVAASNATTLSVRLAVAANAPKQLFVQNAFFYYGPYTKINSDYFSTLPLRISRDDTRKRFVINDSVPARRQLRVVGKAALSALGTDTTAQVLATMEVETGAAEILYAKAAEVLFQQERINTQNMAAVAQRIGYVKDRTPELRMNWDVDVPVQRIYGPYSRGR